MTMPVKNNNVTSIKKTVRKKNTPSDIIVEKLSELSCQVGDIKKNVESIEALSINSDKTLAVQAQQLAEHMRRTDALEGLVSLHKEQSDTKDDKIFDEQKQILVKVNEVGTEVSKIKTFVIWGAATVSFILGIAQFVLKVMG